jgi:photosystem II stability/assembly factor-like uncharacterized protein
MIHKLVARHFGYVLAISLVIAAVFAFWNRKSSAVTQEKKTKLERIQGMMEFEFEKTKDPSTQTVPRERIWEAIAYKESLERQAAGQRSTEFKWKERGPNNVSGRTRAMVIDRNDPTGNTMWTGGVAGGIWVTRNLLSPEPVWEPIGDFFENVAIGSMAQDPSTPSYIYVGTGEGWFNFDAVRGFGIWRSADGGDTWEQLPSTRNSNFYYVNRMLVTAEGFVYAATNEGLFRSTDRGASWIRLLSGRATDLKQTSNGTLILSIGGSGIYRSATGNAGDWQRMQTGLPTSGYGRIELAVAPSDPSVMYAVYAAGNGSVLGIFRSQDGGTSWQPSLVPAAYQMNSFARDQAWYDLAIAVDPKQPNRVFIGGIDLLVSDNGGLAWRQLSQWFGGGGIQYMHADQHAIVFHEGSSDTLYFANDGGIYRTTTGSAIIPSIDFISVGYNVTQFYACDIHPEAGKDWFIAGSQDNGTQLFTQRGMNTTDRVSGGDGGFTHIDALNPEIQISSYVYNSYYITNNNWASGSVASVSIGNDKGYFINPTAYDSRSKTLYGSYEGGWYSLLRNVGTQNRVDSTFIAAFGGARVSTLAISPTISDRLYVGLNNGSVVRVDQAADSAPQATLLRNGNGFVSCIAVDESDENHLVVTHSNYGVVKMFESRNGGISWTNITGNLPDIPVRWAVFSPVSSEQLVIATEIGVWFTTQLDGSLTVWQPVSDGLGNTRVDMLKVRKSDNKIIAATHGRGLFSSDVFIEPRAVIRAEQLVSYTGTPIQFYDQSIGEFQQREWTFGDGGISDEENPVYTYRDTGLYEVLLRLDGGLQTTVSVRILPDKSLPFKSGSPGYSGHFEQSAGDFGAVTVKGSAFERGNSQITAKSGTKSGQFAWVLGLTEPNYAPQTIAALYTPKFDFSEPGIYQFSFWAKYHIGNFDGFQVEYTEDGGRTWNLLGKSGQKDWYNFVNQGSSLNFERGQPYFSGRETVYKRFKTDISELAGKGDLAFRFVFKSGNTGTFPGLAIDDVEIEKVTNIDGTQVVDLQANFLPDRKIRMTWITLPEYHCQYFEPEISLNGRDFTTLGRVEGNRFSLESISYNFTTPVSYNRDLYFLRLKVVNEAADPFYEKNFYTPVVTLRRNLQGVELYNAFPTLTRQLLGMTFTEVVNQNVLISLFAISGQRVSSYAGNPASPYIQISLPNINPGIYVIYIEMPESGYRKAFKAMVY